MPRMNFSDIYTQVERVTNIANQRTLIKHAIQMGLDRATMNDLQYLNTDSFITTVAPYTTGTVAMTNGSKTVTGASTVWTSAMVGRKIRFNNESAYYRIAAVGGVGSLTLEVPYGGTDGTVATYSIYKDEYRLPADCNTYKILRQIEDSKTLTGIEVSAFDMIEPTPEAQGSPSYEILIGTKLDTYSTGTISGTVGLSVITGLGTLWTEVEGLGRGTRLTVGAYTYTVKSVDSDTQITIYELIAIDLSAATYSVSLDNLIVQLFEIPNLAQNIYFRYQRIHYPLINDTDIPDLPEQWHWTLVHAGLAWAWMTKDKEEAIRQDAIFDKSLLMMWSSIGNVSTHTKFRRISQDSFFGFSEYSPNLPDGYGVTFSR